MDLRSDIGGIYIHIPFCRQACSYCDFHFSTLLKYQEPFVQALLHEISLRKDFFPEKTAIQSVYFGGGTPSLLSQAELNGIMDAIRSRFSILPDAEITLEANPDDISRDKLKQWMEAGINRLSIGVQSFLDRDLKLMRRAHDSEQAAACLQRALDAGFTNLTADLIYGIPSQSLAEWESNILKMTSFGIPHLSCYALTVEDKTLLANQVRKKTISIPPDETYIRQFELMTDLLGAEGYEHYEISNFARPGFRAVHNSSYWHQLPYLGLGPGAHGYLHPERYKNICNNQQYIRLLNEDKLAVDETEILSKTEQVNEYLMTHLRLAEGISLHEMKNRYGWKPDTEFNEMIAGFISRGWMEKNEERIRLTKSGKLMADGMLAELFI